MKKAKCHVQSQVTTALAQLPFIPNHLYIGYSGGVDSHVLLHACARCPAIRSKIIAVYIHHGLQIQADAWALHCQATTKALGIHFLMRAVNAVAAPGQSPEEAAREARYNAFYDMMDVNDVLVLAHHQEDQLETVLLQLFRGCGLRGLSGMPFVAKNDTGWLMRPLLNITKQDVLAYAHDHELLWVEDPSNQDTAYDRNFLRQTIIPALKTRWPALDKTVSRSAQHCSEAQAFISAYAKENLFSLLEHSDNSVDVAGLQAFGEAQKRWLLREWFAHLKIKMPSQNTLERICYTLINTPPNAHQNTTPQIQLKDMTLRRYKGRLFAIRHSALSGFEACVWHTDQDTLTLSNKRTLTRRIAHAGLNKARWDSARVTITTRQGGEKIRLPHRAGQRDLKKLFQDATIAPWQREVMPLIYFDDQLAAVGNLWIAAEFYTDQALAYVISLD